MGRKFEITVQTTQTELFLVDEEDILREYNRGPITKAWVKANYHVSWEIGAPLSVDGDAQTQLLEVKEVE